MASDVDLTRFLEPGGWLPHLEHAQSLPTTTLPPALPRVALVLPLAPFVTARVHLPSARLVSLPPGPSIFPSAALVTTPVLVLPAVAALRHDRDSRTRGRCLPSGEKIETRKTNGFFSFTVQVSMHAAPAGTDSQHRGYYLPFTGTMNSELEV